MKTFYKKAFFIAKDSSDLTMPAIIVYEKNTPNFYSFCETLRNFLDYAGHTVKVYEYREEEEINSIDI